MVDALKQMEKREDEPFNFEADVWTSSRCAHQPFSPSSFGQCFPSSISSMPSGWNKTTVHLKLVAYQHRQRRRKSAD